MGGLIEIIKATSTFTTAVSVVALGAALYAFIMRRVRMGSIRSQIVGDAPVSGKEVVRVLKTFRDDAQRLRALEVLLQNDSATAKGVLDRARQIDPTLMLAEGRATFVTVALVVGVVLLAFGALGLAARITDKEGPGPSVGQGAKATFKLVIRVIRGGDLRAGVAESKVVILDGTSVDRVTNSDGECTYEYDVGHLDHTVNVWASAADFLTSHPQPLTLVASDQQLTVSLKPLPESEQPPEGGVPDARAATPHAVASRRKPCRAQCEQALAAAYDQCNKLPPGGDFSQCVRLAQEPHDDCVATCARQ
jgi:hypothetical protein